MITSTNLLWIMISMLTLLCCVHISRQQCKNVKYQHKHPFSFYKLCSSCATFDEAQVICLANRAKLATIETKEELAAIMELFKSNNSTENYYIGYHSLSEPGHFQSVDGLPLNDTCFSQIRNPTQHSCVTISLNNGTLDSINCSIPRPFICEHENWKDYEFIHGLGYFKLHTTGMTWSEAYETCKREGANLAVINSQQEASMLSTILARHPDLHKADKNNLAWLGVHAMYQTNSSKAEFQTIFGKDVANTGYVHWAREQPEIRNNSHCGGITRATEMTLNDCSDHLAFFCER